MMRSLWLDVKQQYAYGNMVTRIILVNVAIFVVINLGRLIFFLAGQGKISELYREAIRYLSISSDGFWTITHPWVLITAMFVHEGFFHLLWNMLLLFWFGRIVGDFIGNHRVLPIYLLGGLSGAAFFILAALWLPVGGMAYGASAGVMAMVLAAGTLSPDYEMRLMFIGDVKLKYIVAVMVFIDIISIPLMFNTGGHIAHLGGGLLGWFFIFMLRRGRDFSYPFSWLDGKINQKRKPRKPAKKKNTRFTIIKGGRAEDNPSAISSNSKDVAFEQRLDAILLKIKQVGMENLTEEEKEFLYQASKKH
jgi:membrane associated rhomboid family serine protease